MKYCLLISMLIFNCVESVTQEKWLSTRKPVIGNFPKLPSEENSWHNTNTETKIFQFDNSIITVGPSVRVFPSSNAQQNEIVLIRHPLNENIMFGAANTTVMGQGSMGGYITTDGGITWTGNNQISAFKQFASDPAPVIDKDGVIIYTVVSTSGLMCSFSTTAGVSWSSRSVIHSGSADKNFAGTDDAPSSPFYGRSYVVWTRFTGAPAIVISYTTNSGVSWSPFTQINISQPEHHSLGCDIATGPNGEVYVCWAAPINVIPYTEDFAGFGKSTNGGVSWTVTENIYDMNGIRSSPFNGWNFRMNGFPRIAVDRSNGPRNGWIYIVAGESNLAPAGSDADVIMHFSSNGGNSWSSGIRVNQDAPNNGKVQFFPAIRVDEEGGINICYYDNRNYPSVGDSCETYMSRSTDGGAAWIDIKVSDHAWLVKPEPGAGSNYGGDYIGISSGNNKVWPFWYDDKTGTMQAWTCEVNLELIGITSNEAPAQFELKQNFPNPFNPNTTIKFSIAKKGEVSLVIFDALGRKVSELANGVMNAGDYSFDFNAEKLSSGVYFYRLSTEGFQSTKKMLLVK